MKKQKKKEKIDKCVIEYIYTDTKRTPPTHQFRESIPHGYEKRKKKQEKLMM